MNNRDITGQPDAQLVADNFLSERSGREKIVIYQVLTRLFGNKKSTNIPYGTIEENGAGKFSDINDAALSALTELGITHVWYTGVIEHASLTGYSQVGIPADNPSVVKGRAGSPYAIRDYYDVDPDLALRVDKRMEEFEALVSRTQDHGLKVILDFVPNHVARKYYSDARPLALKDFGENDNTALAFTPSNNFYYLVHDSFEVPEAYDPASLMHELPDPAAGYTEIPAKASGNNVFNARPRISDWFDTVKLNYGVDLDHGGKKHFQPVPDTWIKMRDILLFWLKKGVDGFRCDMAGMVPVEFWSWVVPQLKAEKPALLLIAEIYKPDQFDEYLNKGQFDFMYDKVHFYDSLRKIIQNGEPVSILSEAWKSLGSINHRMLRFLENHDEQRIASRFFAGDPFKALPAMGVICFMSNNPVMIYFGQEAGEKGEDSEGFSGEDGRTTIFDYWGVSAHQRWMNDGKFDGGKLDSKQKELYDRYSRILNLCKVHPAVRSGYFFDLYKYNLGMNQSLQQRIYYFLRISEESNLLVAMNFDNQQMAAVSIRLPFRIGNLDLFKAAQNVKGSDLLNSGREYQFDTENEFVLVKIQPGPYQVHAVEFQAALDL